ncbi:unnamed protein product [Larinioides sclopetarius]|uniref:DNA mismatch repair proteins mutS family domain-containing protein n=1 Tax=Larinioides sclopetarius TaxID=280406 RepID=A0AAV2BJ43_9ARAC
MIFGSDMSLDMSDIAAEFIAYFKNLPKISGLCRVYERNDKYCCYGDDAKLITKVLTTAQLKSLGSDGDSLNYVSITKGHLIQALRYLLFVAQYKVEILRNTGSVRSPDWTVAGKASPGNLAAVEDFLFSEDNSYVLTQRGLMAVKFAMEGCEMVLAVAYCDALLREFQICQFVDNPQLTTFQSVIAQLSPQECLLPSVPKSKQKEAPTKSNAIIETLKSHNIAVAECGDFSDQFIVQDLNRLIQFEEGQNFQNSMKDESEMKLALSCVAAIIKYLQLLSDENNFSQFVLSVFKSELFAKVDQSCEIGLGLFPEIKSDFHVKTYLFGHLNSCFTSAGERLLIQWIKQPLMDIRKIEIFVKDISLQNNVSKLIDKFIDIEMLCRKIQRRKAGLQDLYKIYQMLMKLPSLKNELLTYIGSHKAVLEENFIKEIQERIEDCENFTSMISQTLDFEAIENREFVIVAEYDETLLDLRKRMTKLKKSMDVDLEKVRNDLGLSSVRLESFEKLGFTFRLTLKEECHLRNKKGYITIDTRSSGVRFQSPDLRSFNEQYNRLKADYEEIQKKIVDQIVDVSASYIQPLKQLGATIAWLDATLSLARVATRATKTYIRPKLREKGECHIVLKQCRHPYLEDTLRNYIPNDVEITKDKHRFYFVTGPNMGGKSTFIRSVALNVLLAQIGSFVPCDEADISVVDGFFTRIGACDNPSKAMSTFMYEMLEVKNMLRGATSASLLIIDEMGRGTSTFDGFGLSWAISKQIALVIKAPCLFATHFHDLTSLSEAIPSVGNLYVDALCSSGNVTFLYRVKPGVCSESFGIHVAKLAAFPEKVIKCSEKKLKELEEFDIPFEEVSKVFAHIENGESLIKVVKEILPYSSLELKESEDISDSKEEAMDVDESNDAASTSQLPIESVTLSSTLETSKKLIEILEQMEKGINQN